MNAHKSQADVVPQSGPFSYRNILVPLDGSVAAEHSLEDAQLLAAAVGATLTLVSVVQNADDLIQAGVGEGLSWASTLSQTTSERHTCYLEAKAEALRAKGLIVLTEVALGSPAEEVLRVARQCRVDLIMMGVHGRSDVRCCWLSDVAAKVLRHAEVPVLLVGARQEERPRTSHGICSMC